MTRPGATSDEETRFDDAPPEALHRGYRQFWLLIGAGWLATNLGYSIADLPFRFLLKERLGMTAASVSLFFALTQASNYVKPIAGILTDAIPLFGTRRRAYLLLSLGACGTMWLILGLVPRQYMWLFGLYAFLHLFIVLI